MRVVNCWQKLGDPFGADADFGGRRIERPVPEQVRWPSAQVLPQKSEKPSKDRRFLFVLAKITCGGVSAEATAVSMSSSSETDVTDRLLLEGWRSEVKQHGLRNRDTGFCRSGQAPTVTQLP